MNMLFLRNQIQRNVGPVSLCMTSLFSFLSFRTSEEEIQKLIFSQWDITLFLKSKFILSTVCS